MIKIKINDEPAYDLIIRMKYNRIKKQEFKGIFIPTRKDIFLQEVKTGFKYNTKKVDDIDLDYYSIHYFLKLAIKGEYIALKMLHTPKEMITQNSEIWNDLVRKKHFFYTKKINLINDYFQRLIKNSHLMNLEEIIYMSRNIYQTKEIIQYKTITFPSIEENIFLSKIKKGQIQFKKIISILKDECIEIFKLSLKSDLPKEVDKNYWNEWLFKTIYRHFSNEELKYHVENE